MKRTLAILLAIMMLFSFAACANKPAETPTDEPTEPAAPEKTVINLYSFTDEVPGMVEKYIEKNGLADSIELNTTIIATTDGAYQPALDQALAAGEVDMYAAESAFVLKYTQGDAADFAASYEDLGIDVDAEIDAAKIAPYSVEIGTRPSDGKVVGLGYQATGSCFIYRDDLAQEIWGEEVANNPDAVAEKIGAGTGNWDQFKVAADEAKAKGIAIVSGDGDLWHPIENSSSQPWIVDGKFTISPEREAFIDLSKELTDNGWSNQTQDWSDAWYADMAGTGEKPVLGFFGPAWLINYVMAGNAGDTAGQWRVCAPPVGFLWGGTWVLAGQGALADDAKKEFVAGVIDWITLDATKDGLQYAWANGTLNGEGGTKDTVASNAVMDMSDGTLDFLGGQDMFKPFQTANDAANGRVLTQYDETINGYWRGYVRQYVAGEITRDEAIAGLKQDVADNLAVDVE
jgi:predicted small lipoprotein YifL